MGRAWVAGGFPAPPPTRPSALSPSEPCCWNTAESPRKSPAASPSVSANCGQAARPRPGPSCISTDKVHCPEQPHSPWLLPVGPRQSLQRGGREARSLTSEWAQSCVFLKNHLCLTPLLSASGASLALVFFFFFFVFLGPHLRYVEVPRLGIEWELQLLGYATDLRSLCDLHHNSPQCRVLNLLSEARN